MNGLAKEVLKLPSLFEQYGKKFKEKTMSNSIVNLIKIKKTLTLNKKMCYNKNG